MSSREQKIRKRSEEKIAESKKVRQHSIDLMEGTKSEETETSHPEVDNLYLLSDAKQMMSQLQITNIDATIATSMAKHMQEWQSSFMTTFASTCSSLIENATKKIETKVDKKEDQIIVHEHRIDALENMADDFEQSKRNNNIVMRGIKSNVDPKAEAIVTINTALGIHITEKDIRYATKLALKNEKEGTESLKIAFFDVRLKEEIYSRRIRLKGTDIFLSEDLTLKKSTLAFEARQYARSKPNSTTWTSDGKIFLKDAIDEKPRIVRCSADLEPINTEDKQNKKTH